MAWNAECRATRTFSLLVIFRASSAQRGCTASLRREVWAALRYRTGRIGFMGSIGRMGFIGSMGVMRA
ncbi:MAG: hypothetical protein WCF18_05855, partial [Chthoniobacteraceae bacterium]